MRVYGGVASCPCQVFTVAVWDMLTRFRVSETFRQAKIDHVDIMLLFANSDQEVVRLNISM